MAKITAFDIDQLRMPEPGFGDPRGRVDRDVLRAASWGTDYDVDARRNAIAGAMAGPAPGGGGGGGPQMNAGGGAAEQAYLNAIGWRGTELEYYQSLGMMPGGGGAVPAGSGAPVPTGIMPAPQLLPQGGGGSGFAGPVFSGFGTGY